APLVATFTGPPTVSAPPVVVTARSVTSPVPLVSTSVCAVTSSRVEAVAVPGAVSVSAPSAFTPPTVPSKSTEPARTIVRSLAKAVVLLLSVSLNSTVPPAVLSPLGPTITSGDSTSSQVIYIVFLADNPVVPAPIDAPPIGSS